MGYCTIRQDLVLAELAVPAGDGYIDNPGPYEYRWIGDEVFQIKVNEEWLGAYSIDFEFE